MEIYFIIALIGIIAMSVASFVVGKRSGTSKEDSLNIENLRQQLDEQRRVVAERDERIARYIEELRTLTAERDVQSANAANAMRQLEELKRDSREQLESQQQSLKESYEKQLAQIKDNAENMVNSLREMNKKQIEDQLTLIKEQMRSTSEAVLKARQEELGERNVEQVSKIVDPLQQSLKISVRFSGV